MADRTDNETPENENGRNGERRSLWDRALDSVIHAGLRAYFKFRFGTNMRGEENLENLAGENKRTMMVANHTTMLDALSIVAMFPKKLKPAFAIYSGTYEKFMQNPLYRPFLKRIDLFPINTSDAGAIKDLTRLAETGQPVFIFPEGRLTRTGTIMKTYPGAATVADKTDATIVPIHLEGFEFSYLGRANLNHYPRKLFPQLGITVGEPTKLDIPEESRGKERRELQHRALEKIMHEIPLSAVRGEDTIIDALHRSARNFGYSRPMLDYFEAPEVARTYSLTFKEENDRDEFLAECEDLKDKLDIAAKEEKDGSTSYILTFDADSHAQLEQAGLLARANEYGAEPDKTTKVVKQDETIHNMTYQTMLTGIYALGAKLAEKTEEFSTSEAGEIENGTVGVMILNGKGSITPLALHAFNRVPAMLNVKEDLNKLLSSAQTAKLKTIVTSRTLVELAGAEDKIEELRTNVPEGQEPRQIIYLEDQKSEIGTFDKIRAAIRARGYNRPVEQERMKGTDPSKILFTSGSTGYPKGVMLSSENILYNVAQIRSVDDFNPGDSVLNAMPGFHAFGDTGGLVLPLLHGIRSLQYPNPLDTKIPEIIYNYYPTTVYGTDTFLNMYMRASKDDKNFLSVRKIIAGGERLKPETAAAYVDRYNIVINEGYGMTEASPVISMNVKGTHRAGTVGKPLPGIQERFEDMPGYENGGRYSIRGKNVMMGYLLPEEPGKLDPLENGWLDTGDIIVKTSEGFNRVVGRAKRIAVIGGENVGLDEIEHIASSIAPDFEYASISRPDDRKGEATVLFTTNPEITRDQMIARLQETDPQASLLKLPEQRDIRVVEELPQLGIGKTDYMALEKLFRQAAEGAAPDTVQAPEPANDQRPDEGQGPAASPGQQPG